MFSEAEITRTKRYSVYSHLRDVYERQGHVVVRSFLGKEVVAGLLDELERLKKECMRKQGLQPPPFRALGDAEVLRVLRESCFGIAVFGTPGNVDTLGHGLHYLDGSLCQNIVRSDRVRRLLKLLTNDTDPLCVQTKAVLKPAKTGTRVPPHTDEQYIFTNPVSGLALWIALDQATITNGCIKVVDASHLNFQPGQKFADDGAGKISWQIDPIPAEEEHKQAFPYSKAEIDGLEWKALECDPGDCVIMHPRLLHASAPNTSGLNRRALTMHFVDGTCAWDKRNWIIPHPQHGFDFCRI